MQNIAIETSWHVGLKKRSPVRKIKMSMISTGCFI